MWFLHKEGLLPRSVEEETEETVEVHPQSLYVSLMIALTLHLTALAVLLSVLLIPALVTVPLLENAAILDRHHHRQHRHNALVPRIVALLVPALYLFPE